MSVRAGEGRGNEELTRCRRGSHRWHGPGHPRPRTRSAPPNSSSPAQPYADAQVASQVDRHTARPLEPRRRLPALPLQLREPCQLTCAPTTVSAFQDSTSRFEAFRRRAPPVPIGRDRRGTPKLLRRVLGTTTKVVAALDRSAGRRATTLVGEGTRRSSRPEKLAQCRSNGPQESSPRSLTLGHDGFAR